MRTIGMLLLHPGTPRDAEAREALAGALGDDTQVGEPDELGVFEVTVPEDDQEAALNHVWDAVAASGTDDHVVFLEHPNVYHHWEHRADGGCPPQG